MRARRHSSAVSGSAALVLLWTLAFPASAHEASGGEVRIISTLNLGGSVQTAGSIQQVGFLGNPGVMATTNQVVARQGANSLVFYPVALALSADQPTLNEAGSDPPSSSRTQLRASVQYDDLTSGLIPPEAIQWTPLPEEYPLESISSGGSAVASVVFEDTEAEYAGSYAGLTATNFLTILNVLPDNYRQWAGDSFDDAWQIDEGIPGALDPEDENAGIPYWQLYAMGLNPTLPLSAPLVAAVRQGNFLGLTYTRNPFATNYGFILQESGNLRAGFSNVVAPVSATNQATPTSTTITTRGHVPLNTTNRQFLRLQIIRPAP